VVRYFIDFECTLIFESPDIFDTVSLDTTGMKVSPGHRQGRKNEQEGEVGMPEVLNERALQVINRVSKKLTGRDFSNETLDVPAQVQRLIDQATSHENLCQCYIGWYVACLIDFPLQLLMLSR
jgi:hypothetical protein